MKIAVASGKGGTGKTTVAVNLALSAAGSVQFLDCDVEGANAEIFLKPTIRSTKPVDVMVPLIDRATCDACGRCVTACRFNAIVNVRGRVRALNDLCHGCGGCHLVCPRGAIKMVGRRVGQIRWGSAGDIDFACGELDAGQALSVPIIRELKAMANGHDLTIIDCPPGTSCPVIESVKDCDFCLMVTEPTPFGLHDLRLMTRVVELMGIPHAVVINREQGRYGPLEDYCRENGLRVLMRVPFDRRIAELYSRGEPLINSMPEIRERLVAMLEEIAR